MYELWSLRINAEESGGWQEICGSEAILREAIEEWKNGGIAFLTVEGIFDTADRATHTLVIKREAIISMSLTRRY